MSYVNADDPRAHTTPSEKERHAAQLVDYAIKLVLEDQPAGVEACNECVGATLILALEELALAIAEGDHNGEQLGMAYRLKDLAGVCRATAAHLTSAAFQNALAA